MTRTPSLPCGRCGERRHQSNWRFWRRGVGYCDFCIKKPGPWLIGLGQYKQPAYDNY